jgi:hypothetical protein
MARAHRSIAQWLTIRKQVCGHPVRWYSYRAQSTDRNTHRAKPSGVERKYCLRGLAQLAPEVSEPRQRQLGITAELRAMLRWRPSASAEKILPINLEPLPAN